MKYAVIAIVVIVVLLALYIGKTYNSLVKSRNTVEEAFATMDDEKIEANKELSKGIASINVVAEQYPDLKANENFLNLNNQLQKNEEDIANARKYYNAVVKKYNNKVEMFPSSIVASMFKFARKTMFVIENEAEKQAVKVEF